MPDPAEVLHYHDQYTADVGHLLQDMGKKFDGQTTVKTVAGELTNYFNQYGQTEAQEDNSIRGDTPHMDVERFRRWAAPRSSEWGHLTDTENFVRIMQDAGTDKQQLLQAGVFAMHRFVDRKVIIPAFFGASKTGKDGEDTTPFPSSQQVPVATGASAATGLNLAKIRGALEIFQVNDMPGPDEPGYEQIHMKVAPKDNTALLEDYEAASKEFKNGVVITGDRVVSAYGVKLQIQNGLEVNGSGHRRLPMWVKSGMGLAVWLNLMIKIGERFDKKWNTQIYLKQIFGATRIDEQKIVEVVAA